MKKEEQITEPQYKGGGGNDRILCPRCIALGRKPKLLGRYEDIVGRGTVWLFCKKCGKEIPIDIRKYSLDR